MFHLKDYRFGIARFLLGLYIAVLVNGIVFRHAHRLADGTVICHAHPYKSSPGTQFPRHAHTRDELIWLDTFDNLLYSTTEAVVWVAIAVFVLLRTTSPVASFQSRFSSAHVAFRHRGPPVRLV